MDPWPALTVISSLAIRGSAYVFLRWVTDFLANLSCIEANKSNDQIPGHHFPPIVLYSLITFLVSFALTSRETSPYEIVADEVDIVVADNDKGRVRAEDSRGSAFHDADSDSDEEVELDIEEMVVLEERDPQIFKTLLFGLPSPTSPFWSLVTMAINVALALCVGDMIFRGPLLYPSRDVSFIRVGHVSDSSANLLIREPDLSKLPVYISFRNAENVEYESNESEQSERPWKTAGQIYWLSNETDYTYPLTISRLQPSTRYEYAASNSQSGYFQTAPSIGETNPRDRKFTFLTSSCIKPRFPYNPLSHPLEIPGFAHLAQWIPKVQASFMLFLGDFIYVDVPHRFGIDKETYRREYRQVYASPSWPAVSSSLPWIHVLDDHEIANDWDANTTSPYPSAIDPFTHYQASTNPPPVHDGATYYSFTQSLASFFLLDTRSYRTPEFAPANPSSPSKSMLGSTQLHHLLAFLRAPSPPGVHWKVVVSSIPFTRNWRFNNADTWAGYLHERQTILEAMWDVGATSSTGVVVLSGDRHEFAATSFPPPRGGKWRLAATVHEFSTSPLSMFYLPVRTYVEDEEEEPKEVCIKYLPGGNSKFGIVEMENVSGGEQSLLRFRLVVDGEEAWAYVVSSPPAGKGRGKDAVWG
ncbi:hypothetical protein MMC26_006922 [Xylographa opegraphella]|nr:hypothetical protein [Xylographa opegraphella]